VAKTRTKIYNEGNIVHHGYCIKPIVSLLHPSIKNLYIKERIWVIKSVFQRTEDPNAEQCPFLIEDNVMKIRKAKKLSLLIWRSHRSTKLADEIGLNLKKLKMGFKQIYGDTVYGFLLL
jgi:hypothetical protein